MNRKIILVGVVLGHLFMAFVVLPVLGKDDFFPFYRYNHFSWPGFTTVAANVEIEEVSMLTQETDSVWDIPPLLDGLIKLVRVDPSDLSLKVENLDRYFLNRPSIKKLVMTYTVRQFVDDGFKTLTYEVRAQSGRESEVKFLGEELQK